MRKPGGAILVRLRRDNDNCTHTSLGCKLRMPKWVGFFYFSVNHIWVLSVVKLHASGGYCRRFIWLEDRIPGQWLFYFCSNVNVFGDLTKNNGFWRVLGSSECRTRAGAIFWLSQVKSDFSLILFFYFWLYLCKLLKKLRCTKVTFQIGLHKCKFKTFTSQI